MTSVESATADLEQARLREKLSLDAWSDQAAESVEAWVLEQARSHVVNEPDHTHTLQPAQVAELKAQTEAVALAAKNAAPAIVRAYGPDGSKTIDTIAQAGSAASDPYQTPAKQLAEILDRYGYEGSRWGSKREWYIGDVKQDLSGGSIPVPHADVAKAREYKQAVIRRQTAEKGLAGARHEVASKKAADLWDS